MTIFSRSPHLHKLPFILFGILASLAIFPHDALATCSASGNAGDIVYNGAYHVPQFCDGTNWKAMAAEGVGGVVPTSGMVDYWPLNESASPITDQVTGVTTTVSSPCYFNTPAGIGGDVGCNYQAGFFDIDAGNHSMFGNISQFTIAGWFTSSCNAYSDGMFSAGPIAFNCDTSNDVRIDYPSGSALVNMGVTDLTALVHYAVVYDGTQSTNATRLLLYLNGAPQTLTFSGSSVPATMSGSSFDFLFFDVGSLPAGGNSWDDVRVYNRPLSSTEITALYNWTGSPSGNCSSPFGIEGDIIFNGTYYVPQFCDGQKWIAMGPVPGGGSPGYCSSPPGNLGDNVFNSASSMMQYCDGTNWIPYWTCGEVGTSLFRNLSNQAASTLVTSNIAQVPSTISCSPTVSISGTGSPQFRICSDPACSSVVQTWGSSNQTVTPGQYLQMELTTSSTAGQPYTAALAIDQTTNNWSASPTPIQKRVFITSTTSTGNIGGNSGANSICSTRATAGSLSGTWLAWISDGTNGAPSGNFTGVNGYYQYVLIDNTTVVANAWSGLTSGTLLHAINENELTTTGVSSTVWTNVNTSGNNNVGNPCAHFTSTSGSSGKTGTSSSTSSTWTANTSVYNCSIAYPLYCFEQ